MEEYVKEEEKENLVGPRAHERTQELLPENVTLEDGRPLYHVLLTNPEALVLSPAEAQEAKQRLSKIIASDPERVLSCQDKTLSEARQILESAEDTQARRAA